MDLTPFLHINPCGFSNLQMIQMSDFNIVTTPTEIAPMLMELLCEKFDSYSSTIKNRNEISLNT